jgi:hypothetical protein
MTSALALVGALLLVLLAVDAMSLEGKHTT